MTVQLRDGSPDDVPSLVAIEREAFSDPWDARSFRSLLASVAVHVTVAERAGAVVGYAVVTQVLDEAELSNLAVAGSERGQGLGRRLLEEALRGARSRGATTMFLEVRESNLVARQLYESAGFAAVGRRAGYYRRPDEDAIVMRWTAPVAQSPAGGEMLRGEGK